MLFINTDEINQTRTVRGWFDRINRTNYIRSLSYPVSRFLFGINRTKNSKITLNPQDKIKGIGQDGKKLHDTSKSRGCPLTNVHTSANCRSNDKIFPVTCFVVMPCLSAKPVFSSCVGTGSSQCLSSQVLEIERGFIQDATGRECN